MWGELELQKAGIDWRGLSLMEPTWEATPSVIVVGDSLPCLVG